MTPAARSSFFFSIYVLLSGVGLLLVPAQFISLLGLPTTNDLYPRLIGMLLIAVASLYYVAARRNLIPYIQMTVPARAFLVICMVTFVLLGPGRRALLLFAALDLTGLIWSSLALRRMGEPVLPDLG
jgi:hypothetical protein